MQLILKKNVAVVDGPSFSLGVRRVPTVVEEEEEVENDCLDTNPRVQVDPTMRRSADLESR
jgi:hypothetical protein